MNLPQPQRRRLPSGRAWSYLTLTDSQTHQRRTFPCGPWGTPTARNRVRELLQDYALAGRRLPTPSSNAPTVAVIALAYSRVAPADEQRRVLWIGRLAADVLGSMPAMMLTVPALERVQAAAIARGWARTYVNRQIRRLIRALRWAEGRGMIPRGTCESLSALAPLRAGRTPARETDPVRPVPAEHIDAIRQHVSPQVWSLVQLQLLTGARGGELFGLTSGMIDQTGRLWTADLEQHKTAHLGRARRLTFGPKAQAILNDFIQRGRMIRPADAPLFSPREAIRELRAGPLSGQHHADGQTKTSRRVGERYTASSYAHAIARACERAGVPRWHPHQLRHNAATMFTRELGLEATQKILGHASATLTDAVYAERDNRIVEQAMRKFG
jgi:integrase